MLKKFSLQVILFTGKMYYYTQSLLPWLYITNFYVPVPSQLPPGTGGLAITILPKNTREGLRPFLGLDPLWDLVLGIALLSPVDWQDLEAASPVACRWYAGRPLMRILSWGMASACLVKTCPLKFWCQPIFIEISVSTRISKDWDKLVLIDLGKSPAIPPKLSWLGNEWVLCQRVMEPPPADGRQPEELE